MIDRRDRVVMYGEGWPCDAKFDEGSMTITWVNEDVECPEHGDESCPEQYHRETGLPLACDAWAKAVERAVPAKYEVCGTCDGKGSHVNPSIDAHGLTREDFAQDPGFEEDYFSGVYDVECYECKGRRVVPVPDREKIARLGDEGAAAALKEWDEAIKDHASYIRKCEMERRMGC